MSDEGFHENDESVEDLRAAWNAGEKGTSSGPRDLNPQAESIVDQAVARFEKRQLVLQVVSSGTRATTAMGKPERAAVFPVEQVEDEAVSSVAYPVG